MAAESERARTYRNYVHAFRTYCEEQGHGETQALLAQHSSLPWTQAAQPNAAVSEDLKRHYFRGRLTFETMRRFPIDGVPELAAGASMWLPVQLYYACHGFGLAALCAIGVQMPAPTAQTHRKFLNMASTSIAQPGLLVPPFSMLCTGDCTLGHEQFLGTAATPAQVTVASNLSTPVTRVQAERLIAKCLKTTRRETLDEKQQQRRTRDRRRNLTQAEKQAICASTPHTSCFDLLYRMRICSNYEDADIFLFGQGQREALEHCRRLVWLTGAICCQLSNIVRAKVGGAAYEALEEEYAQYQQV